MRESTELREPVLEGEVVLHGVTRLAEAAG